MDITLISVGNGGYNLASNLIKANVFPGAKFVVCDTDTSLLKKNGTTANKSFLLEKSNCKISSNEIGILDEVLVDTTDTIVVCTTLGGKCGNEYAPLVALNAILHGKKILSIITLPYKFEGETKSLSATKAKCQMIATSYLTVLQNNDRLSLIEELGLNDMDKPIVDTMLSALKTYSLPEFMEIQNTEKLMALVPPTYRIDDTPLVELEANTMAYDLNFRLNELFACWKKEIAVNEGVLLDKVQFTADGLVYKNSKSIEQTDKEWFSSPRRVMFVAKDNSSGYSDDTRIWLKDMEQDSEKNKHDKSANRQIKSIFIKKIAYLLWGLHNVGKDIDWEYNEVKSHHKDVVTFFNDAPFAFIESKKQPGGKSITDEVLQQHYNRYWHFLDMEINILNPNILVCFGRKVYGFIKWLHRNTLIEYDKDIAITSADWPRSGRCIIHAKHPSALGKGSDYENYYENVMQNVRNILKTESQDN